MNRSNWLSGGQHVDLRDMRIWYRIDGSGPTLLFAHGFPTSSHDYAPVIGRLAKKYRCVSFDFVGFGDSSKPRRAYSYALQHEVLAKVVDAARVDRAVLVVHDYAVTLGQDFLAGSPKPPFTLEGIIFLNGALDPAQHRARLLQRLLMGRLGPVLGIFLINRRTALRTLRKVLVRSEHLPESDVWESMTSHGGRTIQPRLLHYIAERRARRDALLAALETSTVPKAFLWGADDPVSGRHVLDAVRPLVKNDPIRELDGVGHYPQLEAAEEVATFVEATAASWLERGR